ncbi:MAG: hypothetical protein JSV04_00195, partial [Candidatus Heimdallarchaeota archaeon]
MSSQRLKNIDHMIRNTRFDEAEKEITSIELDNVLSQLDHLKLNYLKSVLYLETGRFQEGSQIAEQVIMKSRENNDHLVELDGIICNLRALGNLGRFEEAIQHLKRGEELLRTLYYSNISQEDHELQKKEALFLIQKGLLLMKPTKYRDLDHALRSYDRSLSLNKERGDKMGIANSSFGLGEIHFYNNDRERALV